MKLSTRIIIVAVLSFIAGGVFLAINYYSNNQVSYASIELIENSQQKPNVFTDLGNQIGVSSADDLCYMYKRNVLTIYYGQQLIKIPKAKLFDEELISRLDGIGIKVFYSEEDDDFYITYWDVMIRKVVRVS